MPNYPPSARGDIFGSINVETKIDLQKGEVVSAKAISGHPLLRIQAEKTALQTKFPPTLTEFSDVFGKGLLIYKIEDFNGKTIENKNPKRFAIIEKGIVNNLAKSLPKPKFPFGGINAFGTVEVKVLIDMNGKVLLAKAISGHPLLKPFAESAAREAKFGSAIIDGGEPIYVEASLFYKFNSDHTIETNFSGAFDLVSENKKQSYPFISCGQCGNAIFLAKPEYPESARFVKAEGSVTLKIIINENGNVESADAVLGHPLLRPESIKAALKSKFEPKTLNGKPVKFLGYIVYKFVL